MARTPNYNFERKERERLKAEKKAEKLAAKAAEGMGLASNLLWHLSYCFTWRR
ncbi:MAG: hypothetical protein M9955_17835 [Rhizobiaceae bacterium]|nr:hypothetical protein [Rhizobiaceae bacterium]